MRASKGLVVGLAMLLASCAHVASETPSIGACEDPKINDVRLIGSHNSYRVIPPEAVLADLERQRPGLRNKLEYSHPTLSDQLALGLRLLEIDFYIDPDGRYFASPPNLDLLGESDPRPFGQLGDGDPVFRVMHIQGWDNYSSCASLSACLGELKRWQDANPYHQPIFVTLNVKHDSPLPNSMDPVQFSRSHLDRIDDLLVATFGRDRLLIPDDVRGEYPTLREAVMANNWPRLSEARGKFVFILDEAEPHVSLIYREGAPSLRGRTMFGKFNEGDDEAAILSFWDINGNGERVKGLVQQGFIVRTASDISTVEARTMDYTRFKRVLLSGSQLIATDYYPGHPVVFNTDYEVSFGKGKLVVCDPR